MTPVVLASEAAPVLSQNGDCCIPATQAVNLSIQCQPLAARSDNDIMWPATVRGISAERIVLLLQRRFESRTGLSLLLPEPGSSSMSSVVARVTRVEPFADGRWLLDCSFVAPINEEQLNAVVQADRAPPQDTPSSAASSAPSEILIEKAVVTSVVFKVRYGHRDPIRRAVTKLHVRGHWPLLPGDAMRVWVGGGAQNETAANVRVNGCYNQSGSWLIDCFFLGAPPAVLLEKLRTGIM
jgi:hypothetical protein